MRKRMRTACQLHPVPPVTMQQLKIFKDKKSHERLIHHVHVVKTEPVVKVGRKREERERS